MFISRISFLWLRRLSQWLPAVSRSSSYCQDQRSEPTCPHRDPSSPPCSLSLGSPLVASQLRCPLDFYTCSALHPLSISGQFGGLFLGCSLFPFQLPEPSALLHSPLSSAPPSPLVNCSVSQPFLSAPEPEGLLRALGPGKAFCVQPEDTEQTRD